MHLLIPHAFSLGAAQWRALDSLALPNLQALLARSTPAGRIEGDEYTLSPPHERAWARLHGIDAADGELPWAARHASLDGIDTGTAAWGLVTPVHWQVGADGVTLADPASLALADAESRSLFDTVRGLFEGLGWRAHYGAPLRWYVSHESLAGLRCASLDRAVGRSVDLWLRELPAVDAESPRQRQVRRLQNEVQMALHDHPVNESREARGLPPVNSFWLSGCGVARPARREADLRVDDALRGSALAGDWGAWRDAWLRVDAGPLAQALDGATRGAATALTLCGERHAQTFTGAAAPWIRAWRRFKPQPVRSVLEAL